MNAEIDITKEQRKTILALLRRFIPDVEVWAYGSRVKWTARLNSDLDLVVFGAPAQRQNISELKEALSESDLPFLVDLHVWEDVPENFRINIEKEHVVLQIGNTDNSGTELPTGWQALVVDEIKSADDRAISIGPFGSRMKTDSYVAKGVPVIRGNNISDTQTFTGDFVYVSEKTADDLRSCNVYSGDLVFPHRGAIGQVGIVPQNHGKRYMLSTSLMKLTCNRDLVDPLFIFYFFRSTIGRQALLQNASTVGTPGIGQPLASLKSIVVPVPPMDEQHAIAHILGTLDDKIESNRRMNETLEAMARTLFKSWFVDFDPVRAKAEGRAPGLPKPIADLFPNSFEESEFGKKPRGWEIATWGKLITLEYGKTLSGYQGNGGPYPVYGTNGIIGTCSTPLCNHGGIIIGRKGAYRGIHFSSGPFFVIDTAFYIEPKRPLEWRWAYYEMLRTDLNNIDSGSAIPSTSRDDFYSIPVVYPPIEIQLEFARLLDPAWYRQQLSAEESGSLATLRDALLPKLISGELRVKDAERFVPESMNG